MNNACRMGFGHPFRRLRQPTKQGLQLDSLVLDLGRERLTLDQLHGDVVERRGVGLSSTNLVLANLVDMDDVRMIEGGSRLGFACEAPDALVAGYDFGRQDFLRQVEVEGLIAYAIDVTHPACFV